LGLTVPQLLTAFGLSLSNNANSAKNVGDEFGQAYTTLTGAKGDHVHTLHAKILAYLSEPMRSVGQPFKGGYINIWGKKYSITVFINTSYLVMMSNDQQLQGILPDMMLDAALPPG
jgi:hypothetical protein